MRNNRCENALMGTTRYILEMREATHAVPRRTGQRLDRGRSLLHSRPAWCWWVPRVICSADMIDPEVFDAVHDVSVREPWSAPAPSRTVYRTRSTCALIMMRREDVKMMGCTAGEA